MDRQAEITECEKLICLKTRLIQLLIEEATTKAKIVQMEHELKKKEILLRAERKKFERAVRLESRKRKRRRILKEIPLNEIVTNKNNVQYWS